MNTATILAIGDELLIGQVVNTNASWLGERLTRIGWKVRRVVTVGDDPEAMREEMERAAAASDAVIMCGGLGPTHDDRTREVICALLGCELEMDEPQLERIRQRFAKVGLELNERSRRQALAPSTCRRLPNDYGSAPGLAFTLGSARMYALPGVPTEMRGITADHILPELGGVAGEIEQRTFLLFGIAESVLADLLVETEELLDDAVTLAYLPSAGGIRLRAMCHVGEEGARVRFARLLEIIADRAVRYIVTDRDETLASALGRALVERGMTLATAESCTGGMIGASLTDVPGASRYYMGGVVSYANSVKESLLGVRPDDLATHGAVSSEVAEAMAVGVRAALGADLAVAVTGIAGPDGGTPEKPVGTVWIAIASPRGVRAERFIFGRERDVVRARAAATALNLVWRECLGHE